MKIAIIGGGWLGCHIASKLKHEHDIHLFETSDIFAGSSFYNQNRLHRGFHYSRNYKTRNLCSETFNRFSSDYPELIENIKDNFYCVPIDESLLDYNTYKSIFVHDNIPFLEGTVPWLKGIEGSIIVDEIYINPYKSKEFFKRRLRDITTIVDIRESDIELLQKEYDLVLNTTNNFLHKIDDCLFELSLTLVYKKVTEDSFGSITMVDGNLWSIYPYLDNIYTITDVLYTPFFTSFNLNDVLSLKNNITYDKDIAPIISKIENRILKYFIDFNRYFVYDSYYTSIKVKSNSCSANRFPIIKREDNLISCITGKIQGIYILEDYIKNEIVSR